ncbi:hypothetical protein [Streptomyces violascens]|nr:hypothetical protein [Streptomyces violascens]GGU17966.1 hypothetical protein GCM10010289_44520 [Streptomyces violascens]
MPLESDALEVVQALVFGPDPYLVLVDAAGVPQQIVQPMGFVRLLIPDFVAVQPGLASLFGLDGRERLRRTVAGRRVAECLPPEGGRPPVVAAEATLSQVMLCLVGNNSQLAVVVGRERGASVVKGVVTARGLLRRLLEHPGQERTLDHIPMQS